MKSRSFTIVGGDGPRIRLCSGMRALLLQAFYSIRSERQLMEQLESNLLFHWFVGSTIRYGTRRCGSWLGCGGALPGAVDCRATARRLLSGEHFSAGGALIETSGSIKSLPPIHERLRETTAAARRAAGSATGPPFHGVRGSNATHRSEPRDGSGRVPGGRGDANAP